jgi:hypothetical protein
MVVIIYSNFTFENGLPIVRAHGSQGPNAFLGLMAFRDQTDCSKKAKTKLI